MENFDLSQLQNLLKNEIMVPVQKYFSTFPPETMPLILAAAGCTGLLAAIFAYLILRPSSAKKNTSLEKPEDFSTFFQKSGTIMDLAIDENYEKVIGRAVVTKIRENGLQLEIIEDLGISSISGKPEVTLLFPPERFGKSKVNSFNSRIQTLDCNSDGCGRMVLSQPEKFSLVKRRRHKRKRVVDQQFIRVKIWRGKPDNDETSFADAAPALAVNSYDPRSSGHEDNQVINISNGGIGVSAHQGLVDKKLDINDDVLINIFMFNFRQKIFKPYWYAGRIRSIEEFDGTSYRIGVQFTMSGQIRDENEQYIDWSNI